MRERLAPADRLARLVRREGPLPFDRFMDVALYDSAGGFFTTGRGAGRAGRDFVTSPEVGPLFGVLVARALDGWWERLDRPDPFLVVEAGAGRGRLAREVLRAEPACLLALRYVLVERSAALRDAQRELLVVEPAGEALGPFARTDAEDAPVPFPGAGPVVTALDDLPGLSFEGVVVANELLDNLPFGIAHWSGEGWEEVRVGLDDAGSFVEVLVPATDADVAALGAVTAGLDLAPGARLTIPRGIDAWLRECGAVLHRGFVVLIDYMDTSAGVLARGPGSWPRTYREHRPGRPPLVDPGLQDITADVVVEQLEHAAHAAGLVVAESCPQAEWLRALGLDADVEEGRRAWEARAHIGDLEAVASRSRFTEAAALTDPCGLGGHRVVVLTKGLPDRSG